MLTVFLAEPSEYCEDPAELKVFASYGAAKTFILSHPLNYFESHEDLVACVNQDIQERRDFIFPRKVNEVRMAEVFHHKIWENFDGKIIELGVRK